MSFEKDVRRIQRQAGWSEHTLLGLIIDFFWNHKGGQRAQNSLLTYLREHVTSERTKETP